MINDYEKAQQVIDRYAVTQDHATRRAMKEVVKWVNGVDLKRETETGINDGVYFSIPVRIDGKLVNHADIHISFGVDGELFIKSELKDAPEVTQIAG